MRPPTAPRVGPLATSLAAARPAVPRAATQPPTKTEKPGALAGAFKSTVQKDEEISASFDLAELSAADEWYVAINGVPVGPIRVAEVRRKAALGAVTEESLVWQEGLEEWRPVRAFAELASVVREAAVGGRTSLLTPAPPEAAKPGGTHRSNAPRTSAPPRGATPAPTPAPSPAAAGLSPRPPPAAAVARSNVVPITSRLATAERLDDATQAMPERDSRVVADPFAMPPADVAMSPAAPNVPAAAPADAPPVLAATATAQQESGSRKAPPWIAIAMIVLAAAFGITAALALFLRGPATAPAPVVIQMPSNVAPSPQPTGAAQPTATQDTDPTPLPQASSTTTAKVGGPAIAAAGSGAAKPPPTASTGGFSLSSGLGVSRPTVDPTAGGDGPKAPGQCLTSSQIQGVIGQHRIGVSRMCWEKSASTRQSVNVGVTLSIGPGGEVQSVSASGEDGAVAKCVENDVRNWHFPAGGCVQQTFFSLKFVKQ